VSVSFGLHADGPVTATIVDLAMLSVYFGAEAVGLSGIEGPGEMTAAHLDKIALVKDAAAKRLGMATDGLVPVPVVVSRPADYRSFATGAAVAASEMDLVARVIGGRPPVVHKAYPGTVSVCTGVAASIPGTIPHQVATQRRDGELVIGHPSGVMPVQVSVSPSGEDWSVEKAAYGRTARRLAEGTAFIRSAAGADQPTQG
ncbi:MAG: PrpF domain-containing protein, partial [Acidimicrobiia bacterium]